MATGNDLGRGPDWNDDGLPDVDVEIPDDIRELDREVQAYRREQRQRRRQELLGRYVPGYRRFGPYGVLAPLIAITLLVTAAFGSMMSLLGPRPVNDAKVTSAQPNAATDAAVGSPLPDTAVTIDGETRRLASIRSAVVIAVPARCGCGASVSRLTSTARGAGVAVYLSGTHDDVAALAARNGAYPHVVDDAARPLAETYRPAGLSAVLVDDAGKVADVVRHLEDGKPVPERRLERLG
ncbi:MAG: hypothetical protein GEV07_20870 [Streptosporangiales bacterium]|nr:hypothetical protein [Streptosporangiales bacterium]